MVLSRHFGLLDFMKIGMKNTSKMLQMSLVEELLIQQN